jgi:hypothetical protein
MRRGILVLALGVGGFAVGSMSQGAGLNWLRDYLRGAPPLGDLDLSGLIGGGGPSAVIIPPAIPEMPIEPLGREPSLPAAHREVGWAHEPASATRDSTSNAATRPNPGSGLGSTNEQARDERWERIRHRMKSLGVAKYWIEGNPDGKTCFRCVISGGSEGQELAFESTGRNELDAAESALRRVGIWKATKDRQPTPAGEISRNKAASLSRLRTDS